MSPSLRKRVSPSLTACGRVLKLTEALVSSPVTSSAVRVKRAPGCSSTGSAASSPMRILGPGRSAMIVMRLPDA